MVNMRILNLFSGTGSVEKQLSEDDECVSLDISNEFYQPTIQTDIMSWDYESSFDVGHFDVIICAPPCTHYSKLRDICKTKNPPDIELANSIVKRTLEIIDYFQPTFWFMENPDNGTLKHQPFMKGLPYTRASQCHYGRDWRKTTRFWTNNEHFKPKVCNKGDCGKTVGRRHVANVGGNRQNWPLELKYSWPPALVRELLDSCRTVCET